MLAVYEYNYEISYVINETTIKIDGFFFVVYNLMLLENKNKFYDYISVLCCEFINLVYWKNFFFLFYILLTVWL